MIKYNNPLLPIFDRLRVKKHKKLETASLKGVISKVRVLEKRGSPSGCSYNRNANTKDLDLALEQSRRREQDFDTFVKKELSKLNCSKSKQSARTKSLVSELLDAGSNPEPMPPPVLSAEDPIEAQEPVRSMEPLPKVQPRVRTCSPVISDRRPGPEFFERLSTPAPRQTNLPRFARSEVVNEANMVDRLVNQCKQLNKSMKKIRGIRRAEEHAMIGEKRTLQEFLKGKAAKAKGDDDGSYFEDQLLIDLKMAKGLLRGRKVWRLNHVSFVANVDRMINSVPIAKK